MCLGIVCHVIRYNEKNCDFWGYRWCWHTCNGSSFEKRHDFLNCVDRGVMLMCSSAYPAFAFIESIIMNAISGLNKASKSEVNYCTFVHQSPREMIL